MMKFMISKRFEFEASHQLRDLPPEHKCSRLHGHSYSVTVFLKSPVLNQVGFIVDYGDLAPFKTYIDEALDHRHLNDVVPFNPTAENLAQHLYGLAVTFWPQVCGVMVKETEKTAAYYGEELL